ncbi:MAG: hypothetical protein JW834_02665 [Candidatus Diapherotrites archaeon]|nr:hypothetical protein [Candidatus Diapherotrites archaeon]
MDELDELGIELGRIADKHTPDPNATDMENVLRAGELHRDLERLRLRVVGSLKSMTPERDNLQRIQELQSLCRELETQINELQPTAELARRIQNTRKRAVRPKETIR